MRREAVAGVSGGPDSMALLDLLVQAGIRVHVVHVNYHKRKTANRDEQIVRDYCTKHGLSLEVHAPVYPGTGNFQAWAREVRYGYFLEAARRLQVPGIYVAHQLDDLLETYLMQKKRGSLPDTWGLASCTLRQNAEIRRPLLHMEKRQLEAYCQMKGIEYGIDESNLSDVYERNRIRHSRIDGMSFEEKQELAAEIARENDQLESERRRLQDLQEATHVLAIRLEQEGWMGLDRFLSAKTGRHYSRKRLEDLLKQLAHPVLLELDGWLLERWEQQVMISPVPAVISESFDNSRQLKQASWTFADLSFSMGTEGKTIESFWVDETDFPLTVRSVQAGDAIAMREGTRKISRFFIDRRIPRIWRRQWLVVENAAGNIIFVPGLGCDRKHFDIKERISMLQCLPIKN